MEKKKKARDIRSLYRVRIQQEGGCLQTRKRTLTRHRSCWHLDLGLLSLQKREKQMFVV